ncbi:DNA polymerase III subunits gamma and tau [Mycobacteroides abscessus subsp. abscessus]|nr:DNA polymerase III subunits gamma and tau [Mycobacteroides abscessus subsp. abscessus]
MLGRLVHNQMRSQAALLNEAEPVAASADAFIVKFKYEIHCQMAMDNAKFIETISGAIQELTGQRKQVVGVPEEQWQRIRGSFLNSGHRDEPSEGSGLGAPEDDLVVSEAQKLFGDLVEIKE